jgi:hypothetical protein
VKVLRTDRADLKGNLFDLNLLSDCLKREADTQGIVSFGVTLHHFDHRAIEDFVFLSMLSGTDYMPRLCGFNFYK